MQRRGAWAFAHNTLACILLLILFPIGCTSSPSHLGLDHAAFPPQVVMEHGDFARFSTENQRALGRCKQPAECAVALFNLGFVYAYPRSPYYNPARALQYFNALLKQYPQTPWTFQGRAWTALINEKLVSEAAQRRLQADLRTREATIRSLQGRLQRFRDVDIQLEKKEQELLR